MKSLARLIVLTVFVGAQAFVAAPLFGDGPYAEELSKCLVRSTTSADKRVLVQWLFASAALHPDVKGMATVSDKLHAKLAKEAAQVLEKLLNQSCLSEARQALKYEGEKTIETSFGVVGQLAARELLENSSVSAGMDLEKYFDVMRWYKALTASE